MVFLGPTMLMPVEYLDLQDNVHITSIHSNSTLLSNKLRHRNVASTSIF